MHFAPPILLDPNLLGGALSGDSWRPWRTLLIAAMVEPLYEGERNRPAASRRNLSIVSRRDQATRRPVQSNSDCRHFPPLLSN